MSAATDLLAGLVLEDGRRWGAAAAPFQWADARAILDDAAPYSFLTRPRGASKTTDVGGIAVAVLLEQAPPRSRSYAFAVDRDQSGLLIDAVGGLVARTPGLAGALKVDKSTVMNVRNAASLEVVAADGASAWGLRPYLAVADEFAQWPTSRQHREVWRALWSAMPKLPGSRLVIMTSAGDPAHPAAKVLARARRTSPPWYVHEVPGPVPWIPAEKLEEQRAELTDSQYARLHLNVWAEGDDRLVSQDDLERAAVLSGPVPWEAGRRYVMGVDVGLRNDRTVIVVAHAERVETPGSDVVRRRVVVDRLARLAGSKAKEVDLKEVEEIITFAAKEFHNDEAGRPAVPVRIDPWQAIGLAQRLRARGLIVEEWSYSAQRYADAARTLFTLLRDGLLELPDDPVLLDELANVRLREVRPGQFRADHDAGGHDDHVQALGFAVLKLAESGLASKRPDRRRRGHRDGVQALTAGVRTMGF